MKAPALPDSPVLLSADLRSAQLFYTAMIEKMLKNAEVKLGIDYLEHKAEFDAMAERVIYTGQIDRYFDYCEGVLAYRMVRFPCLLKRPADHLIHVIIPILAKPASENHILFFRRKFPVRLIHHKESFFVTTVVLSGVSAWGYWIGNTPETFILFFLMMTMYFFMQYVERQKLTNKHVSL